jgi:ribose 1,5-bisphosphokinase
VREPSDIEKTGSPSGGALAVVVGPSGAGKDTLIDATRVLLAGDPRFVFARRVVTRASDGKGEAHDALSPEAFAQIEAVGGYLLSWRAHGLGYGIPMAAAEAMRGGLIVVANISRTSIAEAERRAGRVLVLHVTAPPEVLARRIAARGREPIEAVAARVARQIPLTAARATVVEIVNDGEIADAARRFAEALRRFADG